MTKRAKRLAKYLEDKLDWTVFENEWKPCACGERALFGTGPFCSQCGAKRIKATEERNAALQELEEAIAYALEEEK